VQLRRVVAGERRAIYVPSGEGKDCFQAVKRGRTTGFPRPFRAPAGLFPPTQGSACGSTLGYHPSALRASEEPVAASETARYGCHRAGRRAGFALDEIIR
jgi:hypothetical protein